MKRKYKSKMESSKTAHNRINNHLKAKLRDTRERSFNEYVNKYDRFDNLLWKSIKQRRNVSDIVYTQHRFSNSCMDWMFFLYIFIKTNLFFLNKFSETITYRLGPFNNIPTMIRTLIILLLHRNKTPIEVKYCCPLQSSCKKNNRSPKLYF